MSFGPLIDGATLEAMLEAEDLLILDATFFLPTEGRDARAEFAARRLPRAAFYDIDAIADPAAEAPHMIPDHISTLAALAALGATPDRRIVLYDRARMMGAARAWWTLRLSGFDAVAVLDGGLDLWAAENRPLASGPLAPPRPAEAARASRREALIATAADVAAQGAAQLVDARAAERFTGAAPEPRPGLRSGHIPGARNLPFATLLRADGRLAPPAELRARFQDAGVDPAAPILATCGSGVSACVIGLAQAVLGGPDARIYDGSWSEWGREGGPPIATGPA